MKATVINSKGQVTTQAEETTVTGQAQPIEGTKALAVLPKVELQSIDSILAQVYAKYDTAEKLEFLKNTKKDLQAFSIGNDDIASVLRLDDRNGKTFKTSNSALVKLVLRSEERV